MTEYGLFTHARGPGRDTLCNLPIRTGDRRLYVVYPAEFGKLRTPPGPWCRECATVLALNAEVPA